MSKTILSPYNIGNFYNKLKLCKEKSEKIVKNSCAMKVTGK